MKVYKCLIVVKESPKEDSGICSNMLKLGLPSDSPWYTERRMAIEDWSMYCPEFGTSYPVDGPVEYHYGDDLWSNPKRWDLLEHLINWYKERDL